MAYLTIDDRLENAASDGKMETNLYLWKKVISRLRANGFEVTEKCSSGKEGEYLCNISWENAAPAQQNGKITQANRLYEIAKKAQKV